MRTFSNTMDLRGDKTHVLFRVVFFFFITLGLEMSDTKVYEPEIRALLGTASHLCEAVVPKSGTVPVGTALDLRILLVVRRGAHAM